MRFLVSACRRGSLDAPRHGVGPRQLVWRGPTHSMDVLVLLSRSNAQQRGPLGGGHDEVA